MRKGARRTSILGDPGFSDMTRPGHWPTLPQSNIQDDVRA
jgi:hypothetical protein